MESELSKICKIKKKASLRGNVIVFTGLLKETRQNSQINNLKYHPKQSEKEEKSLNRQKKWNIKDQRENKWNRNK